MSEIVLRQFVLHSVKGETALGDTVGVPAYAGTEVGLIVPGIIILHLFKAQNYIYQLCVPVGNEDRTDSPSKGSDGDLHTRFVLQGIEIFLGAFRRAGAKGHKAQGRKKQV